MKKVLLAGAVLGLLASTDARGQAAIPQCRQAVQVLKYHNLFAALGTVVQNNCPAMYQAGWLTGTGTYRQVKNPDGTISQLSPAGCDAAWANLQSVPEAFSAAREVVTRNCPDLYIGAAFRTGPKATAPIPACDAALSQLNALGKATQAGNFIKQRCNQLFTNAWLTQVGGAWNACPAIWDGLSTSGALAPAVELIQHNCEWLYSGATPFITPGAPIVP